MNHVRKKTIAIPNVVQVQCIRDHVVFVRHVPKQEKKNIYVHDVNTGKTELLYEIKRHEDSPAFSIYLSSVDTAQETCVFRIINNYEASLMHYDLIKKDLLCMQQKSPLGPCDVWWDHEQKNFVICATDGIRSVFREDVTSYWRDKRLTSFAIATGGTIFDYDPRDDRVVSYCGDTEGYYCGKVNDFSLDANFLPYNSLRDCYLGQTIVKKNLLIRFCRCSERKATCGTSVRVSNMLNYTSVSIENGEPIISADINGNILTTLSYTGKLRFFDVKQQKCIWGYRFLKKDVEFTKKQKQLCSTLLSFSSDGRFCTFALPNRIVRMPTPFKVFYRIDYKKLMEIMFSLKNHSINIPRDIRWLLVSKIILLALDK